MNTKNILLASVILAVIFLGGSYLSKSVINITTPEGTVVEQLGAMSGNTVGGDTINVGGVQTKQVQVAMSTGTNVICSIKGPAATSTLLYAGLDFVTSTTSAYMVELGKATSATATTTGLGKFSGAANVLTTLVSTTTDSALTDGVLPPNSYINAKMYGTGGAAATVSPVGTCQAVFQLVR